MRYGEKVTPTGRRLRWPWVMFALTAVVLAVGVAVVANAEDIHYTPWLTFTDDADRERQIDSVGAVCDTVGYMKTMWSERGNYDSTVYFTRSRQIAFVEIREWPDTVWANPRLLDLAKKFVPGTFRIAWREE